MSTMRQKQAIKELVGNGGNVTKAMIKAGYTKATANTPQKLTESIGFRKLMEEAGLTDENLFKKHTELLNKRETIVVHEGKETRVEVTDQPDSFAVKSALDMAYKIKGTYAAEKADVNVKVIPILGGESTKNGQ